MIIVGFHGYDEGLFKGLRSGIEGTLEFSKIETEDLLVERFVSRVTNLNTTRSRYILILHSGEVGTVNAVARIRDVLVGEVIEGRVLHINQKIERMKR